MSNPTAGEIQRWSEELARDPASPAFLPLAKAYRRQGHWEAALRLCLRGLERHPSNVEAHALLARLYLESGELEKACDEWGIMLRLEGDNFEAHRGMGFFYLEHGDFEAARAHLDRSAAQRPDDPAVREALALLRERQSLAGGTRTGSAAALAPPPASGATPAPAAPGAVDPARVFEPLLAEAPFRGALIVDGRGLVLAGTLAVGGSDPGAPLGASAEAMGAILGGAIEEAQRTAENLALGAWRGMLMETQQATVHLAPLHEDMIVLLAARRDTPAGWVLRTAARAAALADGFLGGKT
ncbi:MAG: tetratricopeptide repeat protein [Gemmatimonadetes bacterium]|nr:tetratricopeptide repeat protein [Gemmatimonadota bacterium]